MNEGPKCYNGDYTTAETGNLGPLYQEHAAAGSAQAGESCSREGKQSPVLLVVLVGDVSASASRLTDHVYDGPSLQSPAL